ncbi:MAG: metallophosphoesterase [Lactobacillus sp.]|nr:metallophosphoesterase [Lactobacillus sp.]MDN6052290.1 metallophosphoesterase [Lactobacillus sp.]
MLTTDLNTNIWVISDTHLIADALHDHGQAFSRMQKTSQGKDLYYQETVLKALVRYANEQKPTAIVVTGDLTFNGERQSIHKFGQIFAQLTVTKLLVVPGNHDIFDGWAREFRGDKQFYAGEISPNFWRNTFDSMYTAATATDPNSLACAIQLNPQYYFLMLDSNYYAKEETTRAPYTRGGISDSELGWISNQLQYAKTQHLRPVLFMHHNLYAHNPAVNRGFVLDNAPQLRQLCEQYQVKLCFSGHIHAQNIKRPQPSTPTTEITTSCFASCDQGYGNVKFHSKHVTYERQIFNMTPYLTAAEKSDETLVNFHDYLEKLQIGTIAGHLMQHDLKVKPQHLSLIRQMGSLFAQMNYNYYTGHNHIATNELVKIKTSLAYQTLITTHPEFRLYLETLYDTSDHSNLCAKIVY